MQTKSKLTFWQMWNLSFGFFGVQIAYALQSANISRIFATLGADPHQLSFFWILFLHPGQHLIKVIRSHVWMLLQQGACSPGGEHHFPECLVYDLLTLRGDLNTGGGKFFNDRLCARLCLFLY